MSSTIKTSDWIIQTISDIEYMEDGPKRWASGAFGSEGWAIVALGPQTLRAEYQVFYRNRPVKRLAGIFDARDFVAVQSAIARAGEDAGGAYDPANRTFSPYAPPETPEFDQAMRAFKASRGAIIANPGT
jgi:hypothetical protein